MKPNLFPLALIAALCLPACSPAEQAPSVEATATERYEQTVALPDNVMLVHDMRFDEAGRLTMAASAADSGAVTVYALSADDVWETAFDTRALIDSLGKNARVEAACLTPQGSLACAVSCDDSSEANLYTVVPGSFEAVPFSASGISTLRSYDEGTVLVADTRQSLCRIDLATGAKRCEYHLQGGGRVLSDFTVYDGLVYATVSRSGGAGIETEFEAFDYDTGEKADPDASIVVALEKVFFHANSTDPVSPIWSTGQDDLLVCTKGAIYRISDNAATVVAESGDASLSSAVKYPHRLLIGSGQDDILVLCHNKTGGLAPYTLYRYPEGSKPEATGSLVVYSLENNSAIEQAVATFRDERPEIAVEMRIGIPAGSGTAADDALRALNADIIAGTGPDVIVLDGLPTEAFIGQGALLDLSDALEDLHASKDEYFESVLNAFSSDGGTYCVPGRFFLPVALGDVEYLEHTTSLGEMTDFIASSKDARAGLNTATSVAALFAASSQSLFEGDGSVDRDALESFFTCTKTLIDIGDENLTRNISEEARANLQGYDYRATELSSVSLADGHGVSGAGILGISGGEASRLEIGSMDSCTSLGMLSLAAENAEFDCSYKLLAFGGEQVFVPGSILGVNANSKEAETAKEFIAYLLSSEQQGQSLYDGGLPVNKSALYDYLIALGGYGMSAMSEDGPVKSFDRGPFTEEEAAAGCALIESATHPFVEDGTVNDIVATELLAYCNDTATLDDAVSACVQKINLYRAQ